MTNKKKAKNKIAPFVYLMQKILFRMTLFSFLLLLASIALYAAGTFQQFLDSSQVLILRELIFMAITLFFFSIFSVAVTVADSIISKFYSRKKTAVFVFYVFCAILAVASGILAGAMLVVSASGQL